jgi:hypothetical protein
MKILGVQKMRIGPGAVAGMFDIRWNREILPDFRAHLKIIGQEAGVVRELTF